MNLTESQKAKIGEWVEEGLSVADVQGRLSDEFEMTMTYMETRFLIDDLRLTLQDAEEESDESSDDADADAVDTEPEVESDGATDGSVRVSVDQLTQPGALVSGQVTFSDGVSARWLLDQMGRLGLDCDVEGYRPSEPDMESFQLELQAELRRSGY